MDTVYTCARAVPVLGQCDVLVVGSGPAGVSAAIAAARTGADTWLCEQHGRFGGALSIGMVESYTFATNRTPELLSGIPLEIVTRMTERGATRPDERGAGVLINPDLYACCLDDWMEECGVHPLLHARAVDVLMEGDRLTGVIFHTKAGLLAVRARCVIDATGDGDVAVMAGAPYDMRSSENLQPVTMVFGISGVDEALFAAHRKAHPDPLDPEYGLRRPFRRAKEAGKWTVPRIGGAWKTITGNGEITSLNITQINKIDATNPVDLTRAEIEGRRQALQAVEVLREFGADIGFGRCSLRSIAAQIGVRETRRIRGRAMLTRDDILQRKPVIDAIGIFPCFIDPFGEIIRPSGNEHFQVPYGMLLPDGVENLLVAGRCVSCAEDAFGAVRMMVCCAVTGQAAGTAAALSARAGCVPGALDVESLQQRLRQDGVILQ